MSCFTGLVSFFCYPCAFVGLVIKFAFSWIRPSRCSVGIFSRSAPDEYEWLTRNLNSSLFKNLVEETRSVYISNREQHHFREAVQACDFTILYHSKNHGRINITNVTDSLYDEELEYMSFYKGRANVVVVVDDLDKADYEEKRRIMDHQSDIMKHSQDLILVTSNEKSQPQLLDQKLQHIEALISAGSWRPVNFFDFSVSLTSWVFRNVSALFRYFIMMSQRRRNGELDVPLLA